MLYIVYINLPEDDDLYPLLVTTNFELAQKCMESVKSNYISNGFDEPEVFIDEHEPTNDGTVFFDYDWLSEGQEE